MRKRNRPKPFIKLLRRIMNNSYRLPDSGLCGCINDEEDYEAWRILNMFEPSHEDERRLRSEGMDIGYWASDMRTMSRGDWGEFRGWIHFYDEQRHNFGGLRRTILAFCMVLNNEV